MAKVAIPNSTFDPDLLVSGSAKKALESIQATRGDIYAAAVDSLRAIPGFNVRVETPDYLEHIEQIAMSITANGFYPNKPLAGFAGKESGEDVIFVTDGYSRLRAIGRARELGAELVTVPVVLKPPGTSIEDLTVALVQDNEGRPLTALEKAIVAARLRSFNLTNVEIAKRFGCTDRYVEDLLVLAGAPKKVRDYVVQGKVSPTEAIKQVRKNPERAADTLMVGVAAAEASGKKRASAKHIKQAAPAGPEKFNFGWSKDAEVPVDEILPVGRIGSGWWEFTDDEKTTVRILADVTISVSLLAAQPTTVSEDEDITLPEVTSPEIPEIEAAPEPEPEAVTAPEATAKAPKVTKKPSAKKAAAPRAKAPAPAQVENFGGL